MKIIERIAQIISSNALSVRAFEIKIGASNGMIGRAISKKTDISAEWLSKIIEILPSTNAEWLLTGRGDMLRAADGESTTVQTEPTIIYRDNPDKEEIMQLLREQNAQLKEQIAELKKPKFCGIPVNMSNTPPAEPSPLAVSESKPIAPKPPQKIPTKSEIHA